MNTLTNSNSRPEERASIRAFKRHLSKVDSSINIKQIVVEPQSPNDPPDFWITISGIKYPVEVTRIMLESELAYPALCSTLIDDVLSKAGNFKGTYMLSVNGEPDFGKRNDDRWRKLVSKIVSAVLSEEPNWEYSPREYRGGYFLLSRTDEQGQCIEYGVNRLVKCRELPKLLTNAISEKCRKLGKIGLADSSSNPILLFYDDVYANIDSYNKAFAEIQGYEWVHSIFLVSSHLDDAQRRLTTFLYSKNKNWH